MRRIEGWGEMVDERWGGGKKKDENGGEEEEGIEEGKRRDKE